MLTIGLTGGIGSGKSTVSNMFEALGAAIIDTDIIAREVVKPGQKTLKLITAKFGEGILSTNGELDRKKLAARTFSNKAELHTLESILHPAIKASMLTKMENISAAYCIIVIPLLFETGQKQLFDRVLVVDCEPEMQIKRVENRDQRDNEEILAIMNRQVSRDKRLKEADDIIKNSASLNELQNKVCELHKKYMQLKN